MSVSKTRVPFASGDARRIKQRFGSNPRTTAVPLLPYDEYGKPQWTMARRGIVGASEIAAVMGFSPYASPFSLWWAKQEGWELDQTLSMWIGHELEPIVAKVFAHERPDLIIARADGSLWTDADAPWVGCSPDYLAVGQDHICGSVGLDDCDACEVVIEPVECKSDEGGPGWGPPGTDLIPRHHRAQLLMQCRVFGAKRGHLVRMHGKRFSSYTVEVHEGVASEVDEWIAAAKSFMTSLEVGLPPEVDGHEATTEALSRILPTNDDADAMIPEDEAAEWEMAGAAVKAAKLRKRKADNVMRIRLGTSRFGVNVATGKRIVDRRIYKNPGAIIPPHEVDGLWPVKDVTAPKHAKGDQ